MDITAKILTVLDWRPTHISKMVFGVCSAVGRPARMFLPSRNTTAWMPVNLHVYAIDLSCRLLFVFLQKKKMTHQNDRINFNDHMISSGIIWNSAYITLREAHILDWGLTEAAANPEKEIKKSAQFTRDVETTQMIWLDDCRIRKMMHTCHFQLNKFPENSKKTKKRNLTF